MKSIKKTLAILLALLLCLALFAGCGSKSNAPAGSNAPVAATPAPAAPANTFKPAESTTDSALTQEADKTDDTVEYYKELTVIQDNTNFTSIDVFNPSSTTGCLAYATAYDSLLTLVDGELAPELATKWETEDYKEFKFYLRDDVKFHNGEPFTADDVAFMVDKAKELPSGTQACQLWGGVDHYEVIDDHTIVLNTGKTNVDFLKTLANYYALIMNREAYEAAETSGAWVGTGAYKIEDYVSNEHITLVRNDDYWGEPAITEKMNIIVVKEETAKFVALEKGEADLVFDMGVTDVPTVEKNDKYVTFDYTANATVYIGFNNNDALMSDVNFRMAVLSLVNRDAMIAVSRNGYGSYPTSESFWGYSQEFKLDIPLIPYDVAAAKDYLAKSAYKGEEVAITVGIPSMISCANVLQQEMVQIGINAKLNQTDNAGVIAATAWDNNVTQMVVSGGVFSAYAGSIKQYYYPRSVNNKTGFNNDEVTRILDEAPNETDEAKRAEMYRQLQQIAYDTHSYTTIYHTQRVICAYDGVGGGIFNSDNCHDLSHLYRIKK